MDMIFRVYKTTQTLKEERGEQERLYMYTLYRRTEMLGGIWLETGSLAMNGGAHTTTALQIIST